ncbi:hypothetical protein [Paraburkholderia sp. GAS348]
MTIYNEGGHSVCVVVDKDTTNDSKIDAGETVELDALGSNIGR